MAKILSRNQAIRKYRRPIQSSESEENRVHSCLLEFGDNVTLVEGDGDGGSDGKGNKKSMITNGEDDQGPISDPTIYACSYNKNRFYCLTRREPENSDIRDIYNENPNLVNGNGNSNEMKEIEIQNLINKRNENLGYNAIIHTSCGDIHLKLYPNETPKTVENFTQHSKNGYYDNVIFHRVIKGFMIQTPQKTGFIKRDRPFEEKNSPCQECPGAEHIGGIYPNHFPTISKHFTYILIGFIYKSVNSNRFSIQFPISKFFSLIFTYFGLF